MEASTSYYPFRSIFIGPEYSVGLAGSHVQVLSTSEGSLVASVSTGSGVISAADVSWSQRRIVTTGDDKLLKVWRLEDTSEGALSLILESSREIPKKSSEIHITADGLTILASDKTGDIYTYPMVHVEQPVEPQASSSPKKNSATEEKPRFGTLLLGHTSVVTTFILTPSNDFVISGDRDEHIRISWFPLGYFIERFCMGHLKYLSALHIPPSTPSTLISGGGDPDLYIWDWTTGHLRQKVRVLDAVKPFVKVHGGRRTFLRMPRRPDGEGHSRKSRKSKAQRQKSSGTPQPEQPTGAENDDEDGEERQAEEGPQEVSTTAAVLPPKFDPLAESFVIGKIASTVVDGLTLVLFTAVGASGIFYFSLPNPDSSMETPPSVQCHDLERPVLDFEVSSVNPTEVWVSVDSEWRDSEAPSGVRPHANPISLAIFSGSELLDACESPNRLLNGFNSSRVAAPAASVNSLELYAALANLPKSQEEEADDHGEAQGADAGSPSASGRAAATQNRKALKKIEGREKTREKLEILRGSIVPSAEGSGSETPTTKRIKMDEAE